MSTTTAYSGVRIFDLPDLGAVSDTSSVVGERAGSGLFSAPAMRTYMSAIVAANLEAETAARIAGDAAVAAKATQFVNSIGALRALSVAHPCIDVLGYYAPGDGGGGTYVQGPPAPDNGGSVIASPGGTYYLQTYGQPVSVKQFGARGDGATNDTAAINAALTAGPSIVIPAGTFSTTDPLYVVHDGTHIAGVGREVTRIISSSSAAPVISLATNVTTVLIERMTIDRSVTATDGADGISAPTYVQFCRLSNLIVQHQWKGLRLGPTGYSYIENVTSMLNLDDGFFWTNTASNGALQWSLNNCLSTQNDGHGFLVFAQGGGPDRISLGEIVNCSSFANVEPGFSAVGLPACPINGIRLTGGLFGQDGNSEVFLDTYGGDHKIIGVYTELAGTGPTGPTLGTPASNAGSGFEFTINNTDVLCNDCHSEGNSNAGFVTAAAEAQFTGCRAINNGASTAPGQVGFYQTAGRVSFFSVRAGNLRGSTSQQHGIFLTNAAGVLIWGADLALNATASLTVDAGLDELTMGGVMPSGNFLLPDGGMSVGHPGGGAVVGGINVSAGVYLNDTPYDNP
jgi:hypothetical protein